MTTKYRVKAANVAPYVGVTTTSCYTLTGVILLWHWVGSRGLTTLQESYSHCEHFIVDLA